MKLEDIKAPEGYEIQGFDYPSVGDYILLPCGEHFKVDRGDYSYHCAGIILKKVWEPEIGKYYEFSDDADFPTPLICKYVGIFIKNKKYIYENESGQRWNYMRPLGGELGK